MIVFLSKPSESEGFKQIIDFLNANPIKYALTLQALVDRKKVIITEATIIRDLQLEDAKGVDYLPNAEIFKQLTLMCGEDRIKLKELMEICTKLQNRVFDLENTKTAQAQEIDSLKRRVKKLERRQKSKNYGLKRLYKVGLSAIVKSSDEESLSEENAFKQERNIAVIDADKEITLVDETVEELGRFNDQEMFDTWVLDDEEVVKKTVANKEVSGIKEVNAASIATFVIATTTTAATTPTISMDEITLAKALIEIKTSRPNAKGIVMQEPSKTSTPTSIVSSQQPSKVQDKGKRIMVELEMPLKKKAQINEEVNLAWDDIQAKVDVDYELAQRLQAEEQEQLRDAEKPRLFMKFLEKRKKLFAAGKAEEKRNRPPTQAQQRSLMCTYLKNMDGWKPKALKRKSFAEIRKLFDKAMARINNFVDFRTELVEEKQEKSKKQKVEDDKEQEELKKCLEIIPDDGDDVTIDAIPLSSKPPTIVYYKIYKERRKSYFQIFKVDGNSQMYLTFSKMLKNFDREDLEVLWRLVKTRFEKVQPVDHMDSFLMHNLKIMFEHHVQDNVWKNQQGLVKRMYEAVKVAVQIQSDRLRDEAQRDNDEFLKTVDENMKNIIKEQVKEQVSKILPRIKQAVNEQLEAEVLTRSSHSSRTSYAVAANHSEMELKKILIEKVEGNKSIQRSDEQINLYKALVDAYESDKIILDTYGETVTLKRRRDDDADKNEEPSVGPDQGSKRRKEGKEPESTTSQMEEPSHLEFDTGADDQPIIQSSQHPEWFSQQQKPPSPDRAWNKTVPAVHRSIQSWISDLAKQADARSSFNELMDTPLDFSNFIINRLKVDTLTSELLASPTYELMKGSCKSLVELEYHLEEVFKATTDQLDWVNPESQQYPHNLRQASLLQQRSQGRPPLRWKRPHILSLKQGSCKSMVELEFFLEEVYKATTDQLDWVNPEGQQYPHNMLKPLPLIPNSQGRRVIPFDHFINNDLEYLCGGASSRKYITYVTKTKAADYGHIKESARDVYSKRRIVAVTELKIVEWHNCKNLDWITVQRDDDKLYKFKEGDFKRLHIQDIEDMLMLLVQEKLTNLTVEERFAFNKKLNLTRPDTYRSNLKHKEAYNAYSSPRGFIYQNKDKQNRMMQIDELHKFSDGMLIDVRITLDDRLKGIRMKYLP
nr:hypothetical protein [Tanacetum cinerariifolium]